MPPLTRGSKLTSLDWIPAIRFETGTRDWMVVWTPAVESTVWTISTNPILKVTADFFLLHLGGILCIDPRGALGI